MTGPVAAATVGFETPGYLVLLAIVPILVLLSFRSLAGLGGARRILALVLRSAVIVCGVFALAGAQCVEITDSLSVIFLVDRSSSVPRDQQDAAFAFISNAKDAVRPTKDQIGVIAFDGRSAVEQLPMGALGIDRISESVDPQRTDLAAALRMALALFSGESARRVVVLTDGNENVGDALSEATHYGASDVPIDVLPLRYEHANEVVFERMSAPATAATEETINLQLVLRSQREVSGRILLFQNDRQVDLDPSGAGGGYRVKLDPGPNRLTIPVPLRSAMAYRFRAQFVPDDATTDTITANNEARAFTVVSGQGRILILAQQVDVDWAAAQILADALARERLECDVAAAGETPLTQELLLGYGLVILSNVPAHLLSDNERKGLAAYVRDLGGGLVMIGGDNAFGAGGWMDTPIEEIMPVSFDVKSKKQIPKGALVLVMHGCEIPEGNYWAERVAVAAVKTLSSRDLIGIMSYDWGGVDQGYWDVPLGPVGDKVRVIRGIKSLKHGDLPDLDAIMRPGAEALAKRSDAAAKHMIVMSDFDPAPPRQDLITFMKQHKITCSTVAIGFGAHPIDVNKARWIASSTGGKFYSTQDYSKLPRIFMKEAQIVRRSLIQETPFTPKIASMLPSTIRGLAGEALPPLTGYVLTTAKRSDVLAIVRDTEEGPDPILAQWQVGLGKAVAFTSGWWPRWGAEWTDWPGFSKLWGQIARWASRQSAAAAFDVSTSVSGGVGTIRVSAKEADTHAIDFMTIEGTLVDPENEAAPLRLTQVGPGQYEVKFDARDAGSYVVNLAYGMGQGDDAVSGTLQTGLSVSFSPEFRELSADEPLLRELADRTGGRVLTPAEAADTFDRAGLPPAEARHTIWETLIRWMLLLFLIDVAVRRIAIHPVEVARKVRKFIAEMGRGRAAQPEAVLSSLKGTRDRLRAGMRERSDDRTDAGPAPSARYSPGKQDTNATEELSKALDGASELDQPVVARPTRKKPPTDEAGFTSRLLKAKKKVQEDINRDEPRDS